MRKNIFAYLDLDKSEWLDETKSVQTVSRPVVTLQRHSHPPEVW